MSPSRRIAGTSLLASGILPEAVTVRDLRCEYAVNPLGIDTARPRLSWVLESNERSQRQSACRILVAGSEEKLRAGQGDLWDTGKVISNRSIQVVYGGKPLASRQRRYWKVRSWDKNGAASSYSEPSWCGRRRCCRPTTGRRSGSDTAPAGPGGRYSSARI